MLEQRGGCPFSLSVGLENVEHGWTQIRNANSSLFFHCKCRSHQIAFFCQRAIFFHASRNGFVQSVISGSYSIREIVVHVQFWSPPCVFWLCFSTTTTNSKCFHTKYNPRITVRLCRFAKTHEWHNKWTIDEIRTPKLHQPWAKPWVFCVFLDSSARSITVPGAEVWKRVTT
jgi:hypothetical protein